MKKLLTALAIGLAASTGKITADRAKSTAAAFRPLE